MKRLYPETTIIIQLFCVFWILFFIFEIENTISAFNQDKTVQLNDSSSKVSLSEHLQILADKENVYKIDELKDPPASWMFVQNEEGIPNVGYSSHVYWLRFTAEDNSENKEWLLELSNVFIDKAVLYSPKASGDYTASILEVGVANSKGVYSKHPPVFELVLPNKGQHTFYMKVETQGNMHLPLTIWEHTAFDTKANQTMALLGLLGGMSLVFCLLCIKWYSTSRQISFLYLIFLVFSILVSISTWKGWSLAHIWPETHWWSSQIMLIAFGTASIMFILITKELLSSKLQIAWFSKIAKMIVVFILFAFVLSYFAYTAASAILFATACLTVMLSFILSIYAWKARVSYIRPYAAALLLSIVILVISFLTAVAILPYIIAVQYILCFAGGVVLLLTAITLLFKEKGRRQEKEQLINQENNRQLKKIEALKNENKRKEELLAYTSTGLRSPLYGMIGIAETLRLSNNEKISPAMMDQLNDLVATGKNMAHLVNDIISFSNQKEVGSLEQKKAIDFEELCTEVLLLCRPLIQTNRVNLYHTVSPSIPKVFAVSGRLQQILFNLIDHSIQHTREGEIVVSARVIGKKLEVIVKDTGEGASGEKVSSLFNWNTSEKGSLEKQGMEIMIAKSLVELQGGKLKIESQKGKGSQYSFTIPLYKADESNQIKDSYESITKEMTVSQLANSILNKQALQRKMNILVINSEEINRIVLMRQLISQGYEVDGVETGQQAIRLLNQKSIDLIVLDDRLSDTTGEELCRRLRAEYTLIELPILMMSDLDRIEEKKKAFQAGANDYLLKPCDKEEFLLRVETLANTSSLTQEISNLNYFLERNVKERTMELEITNLNLLTINDEIQEVEKSRNEMLSAISHELGTPITLIHSYIQAVKESLIEENNPRYLDMIHNKLLLLERLTEDLVELTEYKAGHMTLRFSERSLEAWINRLVESMASDVTQSGRAFEFLGTKNHDGIEQALITIDLDRLDQVVSNILWNSVKHTSADEGEITLTTEILAKNNDHAVLDEDCNGEFIIRIADNGCGIKKEALPHIFERFYKIDSSASYKGSGLGLAIAKEIIMAHKGQIWADSIEGQGSVFIIVLPLTFQ